MFKKQILKFLKRGLTPHELALCLALGGVISVIPMLGTTSLLCAFVAWGLRLNQPAIQSVNWMLYPLQLLLLIPWYKLGARLFQAPPVHMAGRQVETLIHAGFWPAIQTLWTLTWHADIAWALLSPIAGCLIYFLLMPFLKRFI